MKPRFELPGVPADTTWTCFVRREEAFAFSWHHHREYELTLITEGVGNRHVGTAVEPYGPGDLVLLGPHLPHTFTSVGQDPPAMSEAVVAQFRHDFLGPGFFDLPQFASLARLLRLSARGVVLAPAPEPVRRAMIRLPGLDAAERTSALLDILCRLTTIEGDPELIASGSVVVPDGDVSRRIDRVCRHLQQAHTGPVELATVAGLVHMAPTSFSRFFRRVMGRTLTDYVNQLRVQTACRLLLTTDEPIARIAARSGYQNLSNFNRRFREQKQQSPREYRTARTARTVSTGHR